jgi:hypothetical protein
LLGVAEQVEISGQQEVTEPSNLATIWITAKWVAAHPDKTCDFGVWIRKVRPHTSRNDSVKLGTVSQSRPTLRG